MQWFCFLFLSLLAHEVSKSFLETYPNLWPKNNYNCFFKQLLSDLHIIRQKNQQTYNTWKQERPSAACVKKICNKNIKIFVKQQNKINAKPQPPLTKSMPTVDCFSNQSFNDATLQRRIRVPTQELVLCCQIKVATIVCFSNSN